MFIKIHKLLKSILCATHHKRIVMHTLKNTLTVLTLLLITIPKAYSDDSLVKEFVSLNEKANYETGHITFNGKTTDLSFAGRLLFKKDDQADIQDLGLAIFSEEALLPVIVMSTSDKPFTPDFNEMHINLPDMDNGFICSNVSYQEKDSTKIVDHSIYTVMGQNCSGKGNNKGVTKDISLTIPSSVAIAGSSRVTLKEGIAYLNTNIKLNEHYVLTGGLGTRAYNQIFDLITNSPEITTLVEQQISGSIHDEINAQTGRLIRKAGIDIHLESTSHIASGGVDLFISGKRRTMDEGAMVGVHSWTDDYEIEGGDLPVDSPIHYEDQNIPYITEMLGSPAGKDFYFFAINAAPADGMYDMSRAEMESLNMLTPDAREDNIKALFAWAEEKYALSFAPVSAIVQRKAPWLYVYYPKTKSYIGVNDHDEVWVSGDQWGGFKYINTLSHFVKTLTEK